ncbi:MAG: ATP synthase subunit b [Parcubacteria group bacterium GW2011_GWE2_38_18]|nr:MAG: ATP synthase subunit b [Parcubacteria group bacterium GW2011_GWE2_38_18]
MEELIKTFHIDAKLIIAQLINFIIVLGVLYKFAYKPVLQMLNDRSDKIDKSLSDAKKIEEKLAQAETDYKEVIAKARKEASAVIEKSNIINEEKRTEMLAKAKEDIGQIINKEKEKMQAEKAQTLKEIRSEVAELVALSLEKLIDKKLTDKDDNELIKKIVKEVK